MMLAVALGLVVGVPVRSQKPVNPPESAAQSNQLEEAARLMQESLRLYGEGKYAEALPRAESFLAILEKALGPEHPAVAASLNNLVGLYRNVGNYAKAEPLLQRALAIREKALGREHPNVAASLNNLAALYRDRGDIARAIEFQTRGTDIEEKNLGPILALGSEDRKRAYMATLQGTTDSTISLHLQDAPDSPEAARLAMTVALRRKGRVLEAVTDAMQGLRTRLQDDPQAQKLLDELLETRQQLANLVFREQSQNPMTPDQYKATFEELKQKEEQLQEAVSARSAEFRAEEQPVTLEGIQKLIPPDAALVELVRYSPWDKGAKPGENWLKPRYAAAVLRRQGNPRWVDLGEAAKIEEAVKDFRQALSNQTEVKQVARLLDEKVMAPLRPLLGNADRLLLSPDGELNLIPFEALADEKNNYLIRGYSFTYLTSGRDLLRFQVQSMSRQGPVVMADPDFDSSGVASAAGTRGGENRRSGDFATLKYGKLSGTKAEAEALKDILPKNLKLLLGAEATETALKEVQAPSFLHIATHGFFLPAQELQVIGEFTGDPFRKLERQMVKVENPLLGTEPSRSRDW